MTPYAQHETEVHMGIAKCAAIVCFRIWFCCEEPGALGDEGVDVALGVVDESGV